MTGYRTLGELEEAHDQAVAASRQRIEFAEECVEYYRSRMMQLQDAFAELALAEGFTDAPGFQAEMRSVTDHTDESLWEARRVVARFEEEDADLRFSQQLEREQFLEKRGSSR